jgi:4-amino-4-deoxy-L-arabinose transferase-like glycosyltransferase
MADRSESLHRSRDPRSLDCALLLAICGLVLWLGLGTTQLWDQDEGYYASVAREMFDRKDWIVPTFNQELFAHKPPMMYWGMLVGFNLFGVCEFATRFASAIFGTGMVFLTYALGRMLMDRPTALIGSLVLVSSLMFTVVARSATADVHLGFFVLLAIALWVRDAKRTIAEGSTQMDGFPVTRLSTWVGIYLSIALAVLSKGPIGFAFPIAILGTMTLAWPWVVGKANAMKDVFSLKRFALATWSMRPFLGAVVLLAIAAPWFLLVHQKTNGLFLAEFFGVQHLERFTKPMDNHSGPIYYYVLTVLIGFFPWTSFAVPIGLHAFESAKSTSARFAWSMILVWSFFYIAVFSVASTKLPNYIIPAYPAFALWIGSYFSGWMNPNTNPRWEVQRRWQLAGWAFSVFSGLLVIGAVVLLVFGKIPAVVDRLELNPKFVPAILSFAWLGALLVLCGIAGLVLLRFQRGHYGVALASGLSIAWVCWIWQWILPEIDRFQTPQQIAREYIEKMEGRFAVVGMFRPSMVFYSQSTLEFCQDEASLETTLIDRSPSLVIVNDSSQTQESLLDRRGYRLADTLESFPKKGLIHIYRR